MKLLDKLKNALFEEEYVEIEEKSEKVNKEKAKKSTRASRERKEVKSRSVKLNSYDDGEVPVARKIAPVKKEERVKKTPQLEIEDVIAQALDDKDLGDTQSIKVTEIVEEKKPVIFNQESYDEPVRVDNTKEKIPYQNSKKKSGEVKLYRTSREDEYTKQSTASEYGNYEKIKPKKTFKPSLNISPIYGIIDDTGSVPSSVKKEVRLTSAIRNDRVDVDDIRRKAYGTLVDDLSDQLSIEDEIHEKGNLSIDLRDNDAPEVNRVTVEDAEEYFEDLGLEYDNDYIDATKAKANGKRLKSDEAYDNPRVEERNEDEVPSFLQEDANEDFNADVDHQSLENVVTDHIITDDSSDAIVKSSDHGTEINDLDEEDDNLFDLIDSMYDK